MSRRLTALLASMGLLLLALLPTPATADCGLGAPPTTRPGAPVRVYGDSITHQVGGRLTRLHPQVSVDAYPGRRTLDAAEAVVRDLGRYGVPRVVVMAVGTNDARWPDLFGAVARQVRADVPAGTRLLWVTAYAEPWPGWDRVGAEVRALPGVEVVDWAAVSLAARDRGLLVDGVHLSCRGAEAWLRLVAAALAREGVAFG